MRTIGYVRVSTDEQARSGLGLDAQRHAIEREVAARGWSPACVIVDDGYSGGSLDRPGISSVLAALEAGDAEALVVSKLDRLARSTVDVLRLADVAEAQGWALVILDLGIDTTTPGGRLILTMLAALAEWERGVISERTRDGLAQARRRGTRLGRPRILDDDTLARIVARREDGASLRRIAQELTDDGIPTATGRGAWHASTVAKALRSAELDVEYAQAAAA